MSVFISICMFRRYIVSIRCTILSGKFLYPLGKYISFCMLWPRYLTKTNSSIRRESHTIAQVSVDHHRADMPGREHGEVTVSVAEDVMSSLGSGMWDGFRGRCSSQVPTCRALLLLSHSHLLKVPGTPTQCRSWGISTRDRSLLRTSEESPKRKS